MIYLYMVRTKNIFFINYLDSADKKKSTNKSSSITTANITTEKKNFNIKSSYMSSSPKFFENKNLEY